MTHANDGRRPAEFHTSFLFWVPKNISDALILILRPEKY
jgi:hypothetical protein